MFESDHIKLIEIMVKIEINKETQQALIAGFDVVDQQGRLQYIPKNFDNKLLTFADVVKITTYAENNVMLVNNVVVEVQYKDIIMFFDYKTLKNMDYGDIENEYIKAMREKILKDLL